jgi:hypothetical protein
LSELLLFLKGLSNHYASNFRNKYILKNILEVFAFCF